MVHALKSIFDAMASMIVHLTQAMSLIVTVLSIVSLCTITVEYFVYVLNVSVDVDEF